MDCAVCGTALHPVVVAEGYDKHAGCEPQVRTTEWAWHCIRCPAGGSVASPSMAISKSVQHDEHCPAKG